MNIFEEKGITHLDLHGVRHQDAQIESLDFIYQYQDRLPLLIICGNSNKMVDLISKYLDFKDICFSSPRFGIIRVEKI
jgi:hypothetical protein|tara:strand:+ start:694 stop:927 length:234 start_codon:yes stop_codon:yes gene_type:complete